MKQGVASELAHICRAMDTFVLFLKDQFGVTQAEIKGAADSLLIFYPVQINQGETSLQAQIIPNVFTRYEGVNDNHVTHTLNK